MNRASSVRLQVFLSRNGVCSRRDAFDLVQSGRVTVNGQVVVEPSTPVSGTEDIRVDGRRIGPKSFEYVLLNKPAGYTTTCEDRFAEKTVLDLLPKELRYLHPVGRLDKDTEGLLLLTNDGELTHQLTHPSRGVDKTYLVRVGGQLLPETQGRIASGIVIDGKKTARAEIGQVRRIGQDTEFRLTIHEGRKRQIRLMCQSVGHRVIYLQRIQEGPVKLGNLRIGAWRRLATEEIEKLRSGKK